jgi:CHAT domain-containing protein
VRAYRDSYRAYRQSRRPQDRIAWEEAIDEVTAWLWRAVMGKVLKALGNAPRATLVPAGLLGVLPLHAAWTPQRAAVLGRRYALDDLTLSYTPNARALGAARTLQDQVQGEHLVAVDEPAIGGGKELALPYSSVEVGAAAATFPDRELLPGEQATQRRVLAALAGAQVFHLSCHGHADLVEPLHSALAMARDEPPVGVEPLTLEELMGARLHARLGVLSACETGIPGDELPDEVVSLPTGLLQAGTGGVVASLWSVPERATAMLMFRFYEGWRVEHLAPSAALRQAQRWVRDTTNGEKVAYFAARRPGSDHPMASAAARSLWRELFGADPAARDHRRPYNWAAFTHIGG